MSTAWKNRLTGFGGALLVLLILGIVGRFEYDDALKQEEAARAVRELVAAAGWCAPKPGQKAIQDWRDGRLICRIYEHTGYGQAKRMVAHYEAPAMSYPLGTPGTREE